MINTTRIISESTAVTLRLINHEERKNYCTVYRGDDGRFMVMNIPEYKPAGEFFFNIIKKAELKKLDAKNRHIHITDIAEIMSQISFAGVDPMPFNFNISGLSIKDLPEDKITSIYKFPVDKSYMVMLTDEKYNGAIIFTSERIKNKNEKNYTVSNNTITEEMIQAALQ